MAAPLEVEVEAVAVAEVAGKSPSVRDLAACSDFLVRGRVGRFLLLKSGIVETCSRVNK